MLRSACVIVLLCFAVALGTQEMQARPYKLRKSSATGWWGWECKDGSASGWELTKSDARAAAKAACGGDEANANYQDPTATAYGARYELGVYSGMLVQTLDNEDVFVDAADVSEAAALYIYGGTATPTLTAEMIVAAQLQEWGIYLGGTTRADIMSNHNLTDLQFGMIAAGDVEDGYVDIEEGSIDYAWDL